MQSASSPNSFVANAREISTFVLSGFVLSTVNVGFDLILADADVYLRTFRAEIIEAANWVRKRRRNSLEG